MQHSRTQIDKLGDRLREGLVDAKVLTELEAYRNSFGPAYAHVCERLSELRHEVTGRPAKSTGAIVDKLKRQSSRLSQMQDIAGCRVVVEDIIQQRRALGAMQVYLDDPQVFDRRSQPSHGYRAIHLVASFDGVKVEVQLRTRLQHLWAEISERLSDVVDPGLKYGIGDPDALRFLQNISDSIDGIERAEGRRLALMAAMDGSRTNPRIRKRIKKDLRETDRRFFDGRERLTGFLQNVRDEVDFRSAEFQLETVA
ncbi:RelA/SpoT domain-containing protein [Pseudoxanthomonas sp. SL93]|uniref:RelA/SpoT domain-containing protein n=1 Tax=Pseudoxanthomonas sp. SL93 TaxID=2995142 RepID=UPI002270A910|nr:RelA/SpoT domain-containing protein [Pseudoxanthomonas sp. SL93]WAC62005.1 RelA/SpoT domain-containing protein [Pseudoxanthomonas sp. SL93]